jgi:HEAT repeat protein
MNFNTESQENNEMNRSLRANSHTSINDVLLIEEQCNQNIDYLVSLLNCDFANIEVANASIEAIKRIENKAKVSRCIVDLIRGNLDEQIVASSSLGKLKDSIAAPFLGKIVTNYSLGEPARFVAAYALSQIGTPSSLFILKMVENDGAKSIRTIANPLPQPS